MALGSVVVCLGEALIDRLGPPGGDPAVDRPVDDRLGGAPANVACGLARLGTPVAFAGRLGQDAIGAAFSSLFAERGVDTTLLQRDAERPSRIVLVRRARDGERQFQGFDGDQGAGFADQALEPAALPPARWLLIGTLPLAAPTSASALLLAVRQAGAVVVHTLNGTLVTHFSFKTTLLLWCFLNLNSSHSHVLLVGMVALMGVRSIGKWQYALLIIYGVCCLTPTCLAMDFGPSEGNSFGKYQTNVQLLELTESTFFRLPLSIFVGSSGNLFYLTIQNPHLHQKVLILPLREKMHQHIWNM